MSLQAQSIKMAKTIRRVFRAFQMLKGYTSLEVQHNLTALYNPVEKTYQEWNPDLPTEWTIAVGKNGVVQKRYVVVEYYRNIGTLLQLIQFGK